MISCEKEKNIESKNCDSDATTKSFSSFSDISYCYIKSRDGQLSTNTITGVTLDGTKTINKDDIFIYKTNKNNYGKLQAISIDENDNFAITFRAVTYSNDGSVLKEGTIKVRGTFGCDLDNMQEKSGDDFWWERTSDYETLISPFDGFKIVKL